MGAHDLEAMLQALGAALPADVGSPSRLSYQDGQLEWPALAMNAAQQAAFEQALQGLGYRLQQQDKVWRLQLLEPVQEAAR